MQTKNADEVIKIGKELQNIQNMLTRITVKIGNTVNKAEMHKFDIVTNKLIELRSNLQETICKEFPDKEDCSKIADAFF